jgi:hypothetical protein
MAAMKFIDDAREQLEVELLDLETILKMTSEAAGEVAPSWLYVVESRFARIQETADAYMMAVHEHARPFLMA